MKGKKAAPKWISMLVIFVMVVITVTDAAPGYIYAAAQRNVTSSGYFNTSAKYLYLDGKKEVTYDFNILKSAMKKGATYVWYIKQDKGNPDSVAIDWKTGIVTAKKAGTAYVRCKITLKDKTVIRPEAKVIVRNNITKVGIRNLPADMTLTSGEAYNFNRTVLSTKAGKGKTTYGITRWEIKDDTAGVESAEEKGVVYPVKEGAFKIRAVSFACDADYQLWLQNKDQNKKYITAASEWQTIKVNASGGKAIANTQAQLNKALKADGLYEIALSTANSEAFVIEEGDYSLKSLIVDAPNADVSNNGLFKDITIKAIKDDTWIEYADGNILYLTDIQLRFVVDSDTKVKRIVIDHPNTIVTFEINGKVDEITVLQPADITLGGSGKEIPVFIDEKAGSSKISTSIPLKLNLKANAWLVLNQGSEGSGINKSTNSIEVKIDNHTTEKVVVTTNASNPEYIEAGTSGVSNETTAPVTIYIPSTDGGSENTPAGITDLTISPKSMVLSVTEEAFSAFTAVITPENAIDVTVSWRSMDESVVTVDGDGVVTPVGEGSTTVIASAGGLYAPATVTVVSGSAVSVTGQAISGGSLESIASTIAIELGKGAAQYAGGQLMGWGLAEMGLFEDTSQDTINEMVNILNEMSAKLDNLSIQLKSIGDQLEHQIIWSEYDTRASQLSDLISSILSAKSKLVALVNMPADDPDLETMKKMLKDIIKDQLIGKEYVIPNILAGTGTEEPLLKIWSRVVKGRHRFLSSQDSADVMVMFNYYEMLQTWLLELQVEYYHAELKSGAKVWVNDAIQTYLENIEKQKRILAAKETIPDEILIDQDQNIMIYKGYYKNVSPFDKNSTRLKAPLYMTVWDAMFLLPTYSFGFDNWMPLAYDQLNSWIGASDGKFLSYLLNQGWNIPLDGKKQVYTTEYYKNAIYYYGYNVESGKSELELVSYDGGKTIYKLHEAPSPEYSLASNKFYFFTTRVMDQGELYKYFY